jgi:hypothetical protein
MKKLILSLFGVALIATAVYAASTQMKNTGAGLYIGTASTQKIGFWGVTPTNQIGIGITLTNGAELAEAVTKLQSIHNALIATGLCKTNAP